jgi:hypothetical protein
MVGGQVLIAFVGGKVFAITRQTGAQWAIAIVLGALSIPVGVAIRLIPDALFAGKVWGLEWVRSGLVRLVGGREDVLPPVVPEIE